ncbi:hydrolase [Acinetobacter sp. ANC 4470]|uniref:HAD family hydrolase n=1 Tax=Acinetobacter sp. ANC 4470 TaxID=1977881 RepID=UPI000A330881|nr:HAD family hydrolase [Acinetobacter sp. ANC 4470]OTG69281.1 hydrolase [Acinetobacter sp. ANC 4470]
MNSPKVIVFDAFGTLVQIGQSKSPYRKLMKWLKEGGRKPSLKDANIIMSNDVDIEQLAKLFGKEIPKQLFQEIEEDIDFELNTIELYKDTIPTLRKLKSLGFKLVLCSNLAKPYGEKLKAILPSSFDAVFLSYEVGAIKPEKHIYEVILKQFSCQMCDVLFVGDHPILDVEVPISLGMSARLIERNKKQNLSNVLNDLISD